MKKIYVMPLTEVVNIKTDYSLLAVSGEVEGTDVSMKWEVNADGSEALGRQSGNIWDDEE